MSIENAILKLAEAIEKHANVLEKISAPIICEAEVQVAPIVPQVKEEPSEEKTEEVKKERKPRKSKEEAKTEESKPIVKDEFDDELDEAPIMVTAESVKNKAKAKIGEGHDRIAIKKMISDLGAESILDLKPEALVKLDKQLDQLKK